MDSEINPMFERFTEPAFESVKVAEQEAVRLKQLTVGVEHLLYGLLAVDDSLVQKLFAKKGIGGDAWRRELLQGRSGVVPGTAQLPLSEQVKDALSSAWAAAIKLKHNYISTGHILLGILAQDQNSVSLTLQKFGIDVSSLEDKAIQALKDGIGY